MPPQLDWPELLLKIYAAMRLDLLPYLHIECFVRESDGGTQQTVAWLSSYAGCLLLLVGLNLWWPIRCCAKPIDWSEVAIEDDKEEDAPESTVAKGDAKGGTKRDLRVDEEEEKEFTRHIRQEDSHMLKNTREAWDDFFSVVYSMFFTFALRYAIDLHVRPKRATPTLRTSRSLLYCTGH